MSAPASASPTPEQWAAMSKLVQQFFNKPDAEPFREPVDYKGLGLLDYPTIVKHPMDLGTIRKKLAASATTTNTSTNTSTTQCYDTLYQVADDVRLVWNNCMTYNADGSDFYLLAQGLSKRWEEKYAKLLGDLGLPAPSQAHATAAVSSSENSLTLEEKRTFAKNLYKITKEDVGMVLVELDEKCPAAIVKNAAEDEFEINIDKITPSVFAQVSTFVNTAMANANASSSSGKKKKASSTSKKQKTASS